MDWEAVKVEYVTGNMSLKALAQQRQLSLNTLEGRSRKEKWSAQRRQYRGKVTAKALARAGAQDAKRLAALQRSSTTMCNQLEKLMKDAKNQLFTHVAVEGKGEGCSRLTARALTVVDDRKLVNITKALENMTRTTRNLYDIQTSAEKQQLEMAREELELKKRAQAAKEEADHGAAEISVTYAPDIDGGLEAYHE